MPDQVLQNNTDEEILIKDESGSFKLYSHGQLRDYQEVLSSQLKVSAPSPAPVAPNLPIDTGMEEPMLQPPPPAVRKKTASFYFHPEDEEEAAKFAPAAEADNLKKYGLEKIVNKAIADHQLSLSQQLQSRLQNIIFSYLRDRRTAVDFQEALVRAEPEGGMNFSVEQAEKLMVFLKDIKGKINKEQGLVIEEKELKKNEVSAKPSSAKTFPLQKAAPSSAAELKPIPKVGQEPKISLMPEIESSTAVSQPARPAEAVFRQAEKIPPKLFKFQRPVKEGKMSDVKREYKLVGPVEELASLDLITFRRLGLDTRARSEKIVNRIEALAQDSFIKKAAGLKAWRSCPLYRMYLAVGQAGMEHQLAAAEIIEQYQSAGKEILTLEEFEAISDINRHLRF
ncbi:hypothetical protein KJ840_03910 [Patescibacteria group bacterium]|nr:hypothetical protein [Patescibacteria group bacterium]